MTFHDPPTQDELDCAARRYEATVRRGRALRLRRRMVIGGRGALVVAVAIALPLSLASEGGRGSRPIGRAGTSSTTSSPPPTTAISPIGTITGTLAIYGGILRTASEGPVLEAGTVRLLGRDGNLINIDVGKSGKFSERVPAGRYRVMAGLDHPLDWPMGSCDALSFMGIDGRQHYETGRVHDVVVGKGQTLHVDVGCVAG
jgi:hypothetical protein